MIDLIQGEKDAVEKLEEVESRDENLKISSATLFELYSGIERSEKPEEEKNKVKDVLKSKQILDAESSTMRKAGIIHASKINNGDRINTFDSVIAATGIQEEERILTRGRHFKEISGVSIEKY